MNILNTKTRFVVHKSSTHVRWTAL